MPGRTRQAKPRPPGDWWPDTRRTRIMATDSEADQYLRWEKDVAHHDYAATNYLSIRFGEDRAQEMSEKLQKLPVIRRRANDILRATQRDPLSLTDPGVFNDLKKVLAGKNLS